MHSNATLHTSLRHLGADKEAWFGSPLGYGQRNGRSTERLPGDQPRQGWNPQRELRGCCKHGGVAGLGCRKPRSRLGSSQYLFACLLGVDQAEVYDEG